ncbi:hypothetical protein [Mesorhizobium sp. M4A.F.Ca.ET.050.02.1.1]|uniref:hypothetical protein n=1 Tax=Mesorhizobium sp. M4A.F.Ca.ET.050.02.1.1 TaxID=2496754 RepID=UPI0032AE86B8
MMTEEAMAAVLAVRNTAAEILGVVDSANKTDAAVDVRRLGEAVQFLANAPILGYDVRGHGFVRRPRDANASRQRLRAVVGQIRKGPARVLMRSDWNDLIGC